MKENLPEGKSVASKSMELNAQWNILTIENWEPIEIGLAGSQTVTLKLVVPLVENYFLLKIQNLNRT